ncbi:hypothetical protein LCGC14_0363450 [marine sediment metagenome]|uniref:Uncharacterized protein n=1 Tax=marine sediment metagenome TaxID=412755 RepID=A0A0F9WFP6_9ZZZZ
MMKSNEDNIMKFGEDEVNSGNGIRLVWKGLKGLAMLMLIFGKIMFKFFLWFGKVFMKFGESYGKSMDKKMKNIDKENKKYAKQFKQY